MIEDSFFDRDPIRVARELLGCTIWHVIGGHRLAAAIVEVEVYLLDEPASHSSLGRTPSREPMFMPPGTLYLYYARGGDSLNFSVRGAGNAVLIKAGRPLLDDVRAVDEMHRRNPRSSGGRRRDHRLCAGQTLLCRSLGLRVPDWTGRALQPGRLWLERPVGPPSTVIQTRRLGIPAHRDTALPLRFVDAAHARSATRNPLTRRGALEGVDYWLLKTEMAACGRIRAPREGSRSE